MTHLGLQIRRVVCRSNGKAEWYLIRILRENCDNSLLGDIYFETQSGWTTKMYVRREGKELDWVREEHFTELG
jgi:hypothetical protein